MPTDYYSVLSRVISELDPGDDEARRDIYSRARQAVADLRARPDLSSQQISTEAATLEDAIGRIETEVLRASQRTPPPGRAAGERDQVRSDRQRSGRANLLRNRAPPAAASRPDPASGLEAGTGSDTRPRARPGGRPVVLAALALVALLVVGSAIYLYLDRGAAVVSQSDRGTEGSVVKPSRQATGGDDRSAATTEELDPGIDGGSSAAGLPFYYRRQPVFYRTTIVPGTIVIDRAQRFLYLVELNNIAQRYGIGISRSCLEATGMLRVSRKVEWPEWQAPDELMRTRPNLARSMPGGPGNPLGARAIYMDAAARSIHGTNAPQTIGHLVSLGCIRLVNDDIVDLYGRVSLDARVVMKN
jgi:lipoprotein-anchoring transpeptidase ErfK/SrfK